MQFSNKYENMALENQYITSTTMQIQQ